MFSEIGAVQRLSTKIILPAESSGLEAWNRIILLGKSVVRTDLRRPLPRPRAASEFGVMIQVPENREEDSVRRRVHSNGKP